MPWNQRDVSLYLWDYLNLHSCVDLLKTRNFWHSPSTSPWDWSGSSVREFINTGSNTTLKKWITIYGRNSNPIHFTLDTTGSKTLSLYSFHTNFTRRHKKGIISIYFHFNIREKLCIKQYDIRIVMCCSSNGTTKTRYIEKRFLSVPYPKIFINLSLAYKITAIRNPATFIK